jgi:hypothetical protein
VSITRCFSQQFLPFFFLLFVNIFSPLCTQGNLVHTSTISEYDLGGEGDLFKAPEPIIEEPVVSLDPMTAAISMISCGEDVISTPGLKVAGIESLQSEPLLSDVFYECRKDLFEKAGIEASLSEVLGMKIPLSGTAENQIQENKPLPDVPFQKSISSECLSSMEWMHGAAVKPNFLDFPGMDFGAVYGMRRAFSEGDIKVRLNLHRVLTYLYFVIQLLMA